MGIEPQKFFIGIIDFFSVFLPGALLAYLGKIWLASATKLEGTEPLLVFFFACYVLGHFLFLIGSFLDGRVYEPIREATYEKQVVRLANGQKKLPPLLLRWLAQKLFRKRPEAAVEQARSIKEGYLRQIGDAESVNTFQWCKARLALEHPAALVVVNRFEADSKFFRSFVPILASLVLWFLGIEILHAVKMLPQDHSSGLRSVWTGGSIVLLFLAFWRYVEQRFKATQQAYWFILTLEATQLASNLDAGQRSISRTRSRNEDGATHAGGVVTRQSGDKREYLLVEVSKNSSEWVLPKGHIEEDENEKHCAVREVKEETGVWACIARKLKVEEYSVEHQKVKVQYYLMEAIEEGKPKDGSRQHGWFPIEEAINNAKHSESREVLRLAAQMSV